MIGYDLVEWQNLPWRNLHGALVPLFPPHLSPRISSLSAREVLRRTGAHLVRWEEGFESEVATEWWHVIKDDSGALDKLPKKVRYQVRQGRQHFRIAECTKDDVLKEGYNVYVRAYERYETFERRLREVEFRRAVELMPRCVEFWQATSSSDGRMVAFSENVVTGNSCFYSTMWFDPDALRQGVSYALIQAMNEHYLDHRGLRYVSDGSRNLSHDTNIHEFLRSKFGFRRAYCRLRVVYSWPVGMLVSVAYPFRRLIQRLPLTRRIQALLEQERISRSFSTP